MNTWGQRIKLSIFGESHGPAVGIVIGGLPAGVKIDDAAVAREMQRRAPGGKAYATARREADAPRVVSGLANGVTTGAPLACVIENTDQRSKDYSRILRPGHADWTAFLKYGGHANMTGGGHFSGRLTAPLVFAGAIAKQLLARRDVRIYGRIKRVGAIDDGIDLTDSCPTAAAAEEDRLRAIAGKDFPVADDAESLFLDTILSAKRSADSVGGVVEAVAFGVPAGLGEPFFDSVESRLSSLLFSVPAVKGVEFGKGFGAAALKGSESNGSLRIKDGQIYGTTNSNGGILGGITNGMPLIVRVAVKPTASIGQEQDSVDPVTMEEVRFCVKGRHDPCIAPRTVPVIESCAALGLLDLLLEHEMGVWE
ncbi:MAG: chorismate synthase [Clostridiales Family XIII bacterium]|jgi:chorismate synthase|nr:chorismate synthase [Clostridiales Family XIII bacterium]